MNETLLSVLSIVIVVAYILVEKYVLPRISPSDVQTATDIVAIVQKFELIWNMASKYVILAKKVFEDGQGEEKKKFVIEQLKVLAEKIGLVLTDEDFLAINEQAYVTMKQNVTESE